MKKLYSAPELEISVFVTEDIITTSGNSIENKGDLSDAFYDVDYQSLFGE